MFQTNPDDEEDILSKNARELQIKRQNSSGTSVTIVKHEITNGTLRRTAPEGATTSGIHPSRNWETFEDAEDKQEPLGYTKLEPNGEKFEGEPETSAGERINWVTFEDEDRDLPTIKNPQLKRSFETVENASTRMNETEEPMHLFTDNPVNNNTTYSYDVIEQDPETPRQPRVFQEPTADPRSKFTSLQLLSQPTFYKSLLTVITTKFSIFVFYTLFPVYLFEELEELKLKNVSSLMGMLSISNLWFSGVSYWVNVG